MRSVCTPFASFVHSTSFWPRLSSRVNDSPVPKSFSPGSREKTAATLREKSELRRTKEKGSAGTRVLS